MVPIEGSCKEKSLHSYKVNVFVERYYLEQAFDHVFWKCVWEGLYLRVVNGVYYYFAQGTPK